MPKSPPLLNRVVAITGASSGIGRATAAACAREGAAVAVLARRADRLQELTAAIASGGGRAVAVTGDVVNPHDLDRLVDRSLAEFGRLDVMVCNAGIGFHGALDETPLDAMRRLMEVNVLGTFYAAHAALRAFKAAGHGHLIVVSSVSGRRGVGGSSVYSATKAAQIAFVEALRAESVGTRLHASVVLPVVTDTEFRAAIERDFGHAVRGAGPRQSAERVAAAIVAAIVAPRAEVYPYGPARWLSILNVIAPATTDRIMRRFGRRRTALSASSPHRADS